MLGRLDVAVVVILRHWGVATTDLDATRGVVDDHPERVDRLVPGDLMLSGRMPQ